MRVFGLFSGIGGFELALRRSGMQCVGLCEIDPFARKVLATRFPGVPLFDYVIRLKFSRPDSLARTSVKLAPKSGLKGKDQD
jgi:DNA (cytosine-5)-methyltransferase 1